jgi:hypothetical protein
MKLSNIILHSKCKLDTSAHYEIYIDEKRTKKKKITRGDKKITIERPTQRLIVTEKYQKLVLTESEKYCTYLSKTLDLNRRVSAIIRTLIPSTPELRFTVINLHGSITLKYSRKRLIHFLLTKIDYLFTILRVDTVTPDSSGSIVEKTTLEDLKKLQKNFYISLCIQLDGVFVKFQIAKSQKEVSATCIFTSFTSEVIDFFYFISGMAALTLMWSDLIKQVKSILANDPDIGKQNCDITNVISAAIVNQEIQIQEKTVLRIVSQDGGIKFVQRFADEVFCCDVEWETIADSSHHQAQIFTGIHGSGSGCKVFIKNGDISIVKPTAQASLEARTLNIKKELGKYFYSFLHDQKKANFLNPQKMF